MLMSSGRSTGGRSCGSRDIGPIPTLDAITAAAIAAAAGVGGLPATAPGARRLDQHARDCGRRDRSNPANSCAAIWRPQNWHPTWSASGREGQAVDPM